MGVHWDNRLLGMAPMEYIIDGKRIGSLDEFYDEVSRVLIPGQAWGRNLDAFNDILRGGFGTPEGGFTLRWTDSARSRAKLSYSETVRHLEQRLAHCHSSNRDAVRRELALARSGEGPTAFDWLLEIICDHGPDGEQPGDNVRLILD
jgi:RNAse (barnase) inhibitor barstar